MMFAISNRKGFKVKKIFNYFREYILLIVLCVILAFIAIFYSNFFNVFNIASILGMGAMIGFLVLGESIVILSGGIDLSVGNVASFSSVILAWSMMFFSGRTNTILTILLSVLLAILAGGVIGLINGFAVSKMKIQPLIATLGGMWIAGGLSEYIFSGVPTSLAIKNFNIIGRERLFDLLPISTIIFMIFILINYFILVKRKEGRYVYAIGGSKEAAFLSGILVNKVLIYVYILSGILSAVGGIFIAAWMNVGDCRLTEGYEFLAITAVIMGGFSLAGGEGNIINAVIGIYILEIIRRIMPYLGISPFYSDGIIGIILLVAVLINVTKIRKNFSK